MVKGAFREMIIDTPQTANTEGTEFSISLTHVLTHFSLRINLAAVQMVNTNLCNAEHPLKSSK